MLQPATLKFLKDLRKNNNKPWFDSHRQQYQAAREDFEQLIEKVIKEMSVYDPDLATVTAKNAIFRINRDIRFSKDKSPYKTNMGASIKKGGRKSGYAGYYFHCEPGNSFTGGGIWMPEPPATKKIRQEISYCFDEFRSIVKAKKFTAQFKDLDQEEEFTLTKLPKGYEKDDPAAEYLKLKSWLGIRSVSDEELLSKNLVKTIINSFTALQPLNNFINRAIEE